VQLLVSVRSAAEVDPAIIGGADIIDAKEPSRGSLGAVTAGTLAEILDRVPVEQPVSIALGDVASPEEVVARILALALPARSAPLFLKLGFAGIRSPSLVGDILETAVATAAKEAVPSRIVAVAYADVERAGALSPELVCRLASESRATGVLLDTHTKDGQSLLKWIRLSDLTVWVSRARGIGLLTALAGGLGMDELALVAQASPDVVGVRGAACEGGRHGSVTLGRVLALRKCLDFGGLADLALGESPTPGTPVRETRERGRDSPGRTVLSP
jgi:(5-formylfuran-3-yl)methyl phosphate synthase